MGGSKEKIRKERCKEEAKGKGGKQTELGRGERERKRREQKIKGRTGWLGG